MNDCVGMILDPVNHVKWSDLPENQQATEFTRRTSHYLKYHHIEKRQELQQLSDDRPIFLDEL